MSQSNQCRGAWKLHHTSEYMPTPPLTRMSARHDSRRLQQGDTDGTIAILIIVIVVFLIIWAPTAIRRWRNRNSGEAAGEEDPARNRLADVYLEAVIMRRLAELNRFRVQHVQHHNLSEADRREYIRNVLLTRKVVIDESSESDGETGSNPTKADDASVHLKPSLKADTPEDDENCCAICLNEYKNGDEVCFSNNKFCNHFFHKDCISEWLVTHEECPCCRHFFLFFVENDRDLELYEQRPRHRGTLPPGPVAAAIAPSLSSHLQNREDGSDSLVQNPVQQTTGVNADEQLLSSGVVQGDSRGGATPESELSTFNVLPIGMNAEAIPEASVLVPATNALDRFQVEGQPEGPTADPTLNVHVPVARVDAGGQREPSLRGFDQAIDV